MGSERRRAERELGARKGEADVDSAQIADHAAMFLLLAMRLGGRNLLNVSRKEKTGAGWCGHFGKKSQGSDRKHEHEVADRPVVRMRDVDARTAQRNNLPPPKLLARSVLGFDHMPNPQALSNRGVSTRIPGLSYCFCCGNLPMPSLKLPRLHTYRDRGSDRARPVLSAEGEQY